MLYCRLLTCFFSKLLFSNKKNFQEHYIRVSNGLDPDLSQLFAKIIGVARTLKRLRTSKGDYWIKQWFSSIASLFKMGTSLRGKNLLPEGANSSLLRAVPYTLESHLQHKGTSLECYSFNTHVRMCVMGATLMKIISR